ncbi:GMC family oxidoreductase [Ruegeria sp. R14_0]|uniref:GMC oxidoreductase n=1 Tax=Ruegeria sp. R14_0 TaxID=2821100 RepID=UPI001ADA4C9F|nr:GMC family oxidoreductase [Ruegeria sp. R14_0]MBO9446302.1 GMC family oxidoreductase [Ruegeria sp. R14_0]
MRRVSLDQASSREWDVIIAGSSFSAMFFGHGLPPDLNVLFVEKGVEYTHADQIENGWAVRETFNQRNSSGLKKNWVAFTLFGGNSNYWWGNVPRFHPDDFSLNSKFGVGMDWPITYQDLEPFWERVEDIIEVAGGENDHILPRRTPFPYPPHTPSRADVALRASSPLWVPVSSATSNGGSRPTCCVNGVCRICPIDAKFTVLNGLEKLTHPVAHYLFDAEVRTVDIEGGRATGVSVKTADGADARLRGNTVALGTNGIFNAAILQRSGVRNEALGKYLHEQAVINVYADTANIKGFFGGTSETGHGYHFYHDIDRSTAAAALIETVNAPASVRRERGKWANRIHMRIAVEDLPRAENRVFLEEDEPVIEWTGYSDYAKRGVERAKTGLPDVIPDTIEHLEVSDILPSDAHIQGTHRMGLSADDSVVDDRLRLHSASNVFVLGSGAFPTCSPANPSLTLSALALRASEAVG